MYVTLSPKDKKFSELNYGDFFQSGPFFYFKIKTPSKHNAVNLCTFLSTQFDDDETVTYLNPNAPEFFDSIDKKQEHLASI